MKPNTAQQRVHRAILSGKLPRLDGTIPCTDCAGPAVAYDHRRYSDPLAVEPVCQSCNLLRGPASDRERGPETNTTTTAAALCRKCYAPVDRTPSGPKRPRYCPACLALPGLPLPQSHLRVLVPSFTRRQIQYLIDTGTIPATTDALPRLRLIAAALSWGLTLHAIRPALPRLLARRLPLDRIKATTIGPFVLLETL